MYRQLRSRLVPGLENSHITYARILQQVVTPEATWLDLGCGHSLVPDWLPEQPTQLEGLAYGVDADLRSLESHRGLRHRVAGDVHRLPFTDAAFDVVTANMVIEHITDPPALFRELHRVLRPGGRLLIHTPNARGYTTRAARVVPEPLKAVCARIIQQRHVEDVYPAYYRANTREALERAARSAGLSLRTCEHVLTSPQLWKLPAVRVVELFWIRHIARSQHAAQRPVLIATLVKADAGMGAYAAG